MFHQAPHSLNDITIQMPQNQARRNRMVRRIAMGIAALALSWPWAADRPREQKYQEANRILYTARSEDLGQSAGQIVRVHDLTTGQDREIHRSRNITGCIWGSEPSKLFCRELSPGGLQADQSNVYSLALKSGAIEPLARWDIATKNETVLRRGSPTRSGRPRVTPDARWIVWTEGFRLQVRPASGGDWKPLVTIDNAVTSNTSAVEYAPNTRQPLGALPRRGFRRKARIVPRSDFRRRARAAGRLRRTRGLVREPRG
jgi:hypothetical protein